MDSETVHGTVRSGAGSVPEAGMTKSTTMMSSFIMTLSLFKAPSSGGAFPFQRPAEIFGLPPFALYAVYR
ncbi:TPA: hypothetical protein JRV81_000286 [Escherichia coli]|nr:hypothetical protein ELY03_23455 [Escherichia coli]TFP96272.1 hypothetical protein ELV20_22865 [Escherichia coli]HAY3334721.1 hypothetical protein [Escherichia coli]HAY4086040.1 hypothetical protein [Escherichia coli]HBE3870988.1 hypothetical protein [Escherichia coli]